MKQSLRKEKNPQDIQNLQAVLPVAEANLQAAQNELANASAQIADIEKTRDATLAPIIEKENASMNKSQVVVRFWSIISS
jgi:hypothetical protein